MSSLKDALKQAGFKPSKSENERPQVRQKDKKKTEVHQEQRNYCEACDRTLPDVELYNHRNPTLDVKWICVQCADRHKIDDKFRKTAQSDFAKRNLFKREYGPTLKIETK